MRTIPFENFPLRMVVAANAVGLGIYVIGMFLMLQLGFAWGMLYAAYCFWMEWRLLSGSCRSCYYYGKRCGFGKGMVCSWFFERTELPLAGKRISWLDIVPDFLVPVIPIVAGIIVLVRNFSWTVLVPVLVLTFLGTIGTGLVRGQIACKYCKQRELGCPAEQLFGKKKCE